MSAENNSLRRGWVLTTLGEIVEPTRPRHSPQDFADFPFIGMENIEAHTMKLLGTVLAGTMKSSAVHFQPSDVLYGRLRPYLNKVFCPDFEGLCSAEFIVFPQSEHLNSKFIQYLLNSADFVSFASHINAGDRPRVDFEQIAQYRVPVPPLPEQQRIVAEVEKQFTRLEAAVRALKRVQANLKRYRAAVLKAGVEGRLAPTEAELARAEGRSYEPASELLRRILAERRTQWEADQIARFRASGKEPTDDKWKKKYQEPFAPNEGRLAALPEGWTWATVDQLADVGTGATPLRSNATYYSEGSIPWVTSAALNERFVSEAKEFVTERALRETNLTIYEPGTILVAMYGEGRTRGRCSKLKIAATTNQAIAALVFHGTSVECRAYVRLFLEKNYEDVRRLSSGGVQPNLNLGLIRRIAIPFPPTAEQHRIVAEAERSHSLTDELEMQIEANLKRAQRLRQAILKRAFEGKLVPQDPSDEPAAVLLERICAEREARKQPVGGTKKSSKGKHAKAVAATEG
jgi:type I restriction enzyme S subunit